MNMKRIKFATLIVTIVAGAMTLSSCGSTGSATKQKGIVLQEGDNATLVSENGYTTITMPVEKTADDLALYDTDVLGYLLKSNAPISTDGGTWDNDRIYYYMHNSKEWLHLGNYEHPYEIEMTKVKSIRISNNRLRLREFVDQMPLLANSKEKKSDNSFQDEVSFGSSYYYFIEIVVNDR
jgi:hypothetical protein